MNELDKFAENLVDPVWKLTLQNWHAVEPDTAEFLGAEVIRARLEERWFEAMLRVVSCFLSS